MIKILTVIGARPQFIKAAAISHTINSHYSDEIEEVLVHTGQHYDANMSEVFFNELSIPHEKYNLQIGSGSHAIQTARMMEGLEGVIAKEQPDAVLLYGDTNSTLAGAVTASKLEIPIIHVEAGLRSFTKNMPEEINRVVCDHLSTLLFTPTIAGLNNLKQEGFQLENKGPFTVDNPGVYHCGDVMYDISLMYKQIASEKSSILTALNINNKKFILATVHRQDNTSDNNILTQILFALDQVSQESGIQVILPLHPRTKKILDDHFKDVDWTQNKISSGIKVIDPVSYLDMVQLESNCCMIITDSGGVQKEAYFYKKPCIILQNETPWIELLENGSTILVGSDKVKLIKAFHELRDDNRVFEFSDIFGDGNGSKFIIERIIANIRN